MTSARRRLGFTLIELLVVIAIIAVLIALLVPAVQKVRESANRAECENKLKQMALACHAFHGDFKNFPIAGYGIGTLANNNFDQSWMVLILPYVEQTAVYDAIMGDFTSFIAAGSTVTSFDAAFGSGQAGIPVKLFYCPSDPRGFIFDPHDVFSGVKVAMTDYVGISGYDITSSGNPANSGIFQNNSSFVGCSTATSAAVRLNMVTDGTSNTLLIGERPFITPGTLGIQNDGLSGLGYWIWSGCGWDADTISGVQNTNAAAANASTTGASCGSGPFYYGSANSPKSITNACSFNYLWSLHSGGSNFALADGSVRFASYSISTTTLAAASTYGGSETLGSDW